MKKKTENRDSNRRFKIQEILLQTLYINIRFGSWQVRLISRYPNVCYVGLLIGL